MPLGQRQLFVYWRVAEPELGDALAALRAWQAQLMSRHPGLRCGRYLRGDDNRQGHSTVMESYAIDAPASHPGIGPALQQQIEQQGLVQLQGWLRGARQVEVFDALPG